ncbi:hypothetical protein O1R50_02520 [Glycomyces luteolus]|uniref:Uncharacterized protein n=1 Tax=Glycomyces luteolus TaxID=2670330 RepID=A0A9X3P4J2_9ACTN|nr:hypothetical protein [Glycomyces luteolus]MDA1358476.1 hypothetical protein [Glycomyces luteolus]
MRKFRLSRLVLAATVIGVVGLFSLPAILGGAAASDRAAESRSAISHVDWTNADETYPVPPGSPTPSPSYDGDGTSDTDGGDTDGDGSPDPTDGGASPESGPKDSGSGRGGDGGLLGLAFPLQAGLSVGLLALAFLALLPGRRMPANLR